MTPHGRERAIDTETVRSLLKRVTHAENVRIAEKHGGMGEERKEYDILEGNERLTHGLSVDRYGKQHEILFELVRHIGRFAGRKDLLKKEWVENDWFVALPKHCAGIAKPLRPLVGTAYHTIYTPFERESRYSVQTGCIVVEETPPYVMFMLVRSAKLCLQTTVIKTDPIAEIDGFTIAAVKDTLTAISTNDKMLVMSRRAGDKPAITVGKYEFETVGKMVDLAWKFAEMED